MLESFFISLGLAVAGWLEFGMSHTTGSVAWRFPLAFSCFFAVAVVCSLPFWPESPRWLVKEGRIEDAREVLAALDDVSLDDPGVARDIKEIQESLEIMGKGKFRDIFRNGPGRFANRAFIAAAAQCFQQMCGINALAFYQTTIFETYLGLAPNTARILTATVFTWQLCPSVPLVDASLMVL